MRTRILNTQIHAQGVMTFDTNRGKDCAYVQNLLDIHAPWTEAKTYGRDSVDGTVNHEKRWSQNCRLSDISDETANKEIDTIVYDMMSTAEKIYADKYKVQVDAFDYIEFLKYGTGGHYIPHADQCTGDRKASLLIYLNDGYSGGETLFPETYGKNGLGVKITPKAGRVLIFDCSYTFIHTGLPVTKGTKYILYSFLCEDGVTTAPSNTPTLYNF